MIHFCTIGRVPPIPIWAVRAEMPDDAYVGLIPWLHVWGAWRARILARRLGYPHQAPEQQLMPITYQGSPEDDAEAERIDEAVGRLMRVGLQMQATLLLRTYVHRKRTPRRQLEPALRALAFALSTL